MKNQKGIIFDLRGTLVDRDYSIFPDIKETLQELKNRGYKLGLISTHKNIEERKKVIKAMGIAHLFDVIIVDSEKTIEHFKKCMNKLGVIPATTAVVDDRTIRGVKDGNALGCKTFWIQRGKYENELPNETTGEPTHRIDKVSELLDYL
jgi:FMN phosphatase YigB (HAD superfamily)